MKCPDCGHEMPETNCLYCNTNSVVINPTTLQQKTLSRINAYDKNIHHKFSAKYEIQKAICTLQGLLKGIAIDGIINPLELAELKNWCEIHNILLNRHPFSELIPTVLNAIADGYLAEEEINDINWLCTNLTSENIYQNAITDDILRLQGILHGILADNNITTEEIKGLQDWLDDNSHLESTYPYDEIYSLILSVLKDGLLDDDEKKLLKAFFVDFLDVEHSKNIDRSDIVTLKKSMSKLGICATCPDISISQKLFCFTGKSSKLTRHDFATIITSLGGLYKDNVVAGTEYLIIGNEGNPCWAFSCYGRKVEAAIKLRKDGKNLLIVHENDFWDFYADYMASFGKIG